VTLVPFLAAAGELKTKPTQQSVAKLREIGIQPHVLVCRCDHPLDMDLRDKLSMFCNVPVKAVIECRDVDSSIYQLPLALQKERMDELVLDLLGFSIPAPKKNIWIEIVRRLLNPKHEVTIGVVGKYIELQDAYKSVYESIAHAGIANTCKVNVRRIDAEDLEKKGGMKLLKGLDGILVPGGFGDRGTDGKIAAARFAREKGVPYYGLCLGLQIAVIEIARNVLKIAGANSTEFDPKCVDPVINMMEEQKAITDKGATMRLGSYDCALTPGTLAAKAYGATMVRERHRHRYEVNNAYLDVLKPVMVVSGINPKRNLVEIMELKGHPWFVGVQFHPEFQSKPNRAHPLFAAFHRGGDPAPARRQALEAGEGRQGVKIFDPRRLLLIAGPCSLESEKVCRAVATRLAALRKAHPSSRSCSRAPSTRRTGRPSRARGARASGTALRCSPSSAGSTGSPCSPTSTRACRSRRSPGCATCCRSPRSCAGRRTSSSRRPPPAGRST
jgi:CTP synthase